MITFSDHGLRMMGYPSPKFEYHLPPLDHLFSRNMANVGLDRLSGRIVGPTTYPHFNMWMNLVRLTDLAIQEYEDARRSLEDYRAHAHQGRVSPLYDAVNGLEEVVVATYRAVLNSAGVQSVVKRKLNQPTPRQEDTLRLVRNHIQHMDDKLSRGSVRPGELHILAPTEHALQIGAKRLAYRDLASCIVKMYRNIEIIREAPSK